MAASPAPDGPRGSFLSGNLSEYGRDQLGALERWARDYGDIVPLRFGPTRAFLLNHPALIEDLLVTQHRNVRKPEAARRLRPVVGNGVFSSDGDSWLRQRRLLQPAFHRERIGAYGEIMVGYTTDMLEGWRPGQRIDVRAEMSALTLRIVAKALFGAEVASDVTDVAEALAVASEHLQTRLDSLLFYLPDWVPTAGNRRMWRAVRRLEAVIYRILAERRADGRDHGDLLSILLQAHEEDGERMTDRQLRDELVTLMVAGHETTAVTLSWAWYLLAQHGDIADRLGAELDKVLGDRLPETMDLPQLHLAEHVIYETLRLYPPAYATGREALRDILVGGQPVRRGNILLISFWAMHRDPHWFEAPDSFRPDRWADGLAKRLPRGVYTPFGAGPRQCIGAGFAMQEAALLLATIAQQYRLTLEPGQQIRPVAAVNLRPNGPIWMRVSRPLRRAVTPMSEGKRVSQ